MTPRCKHCGKFVRKEESRITWDYSWNPDIEYFHQACQDKWHEKLEEIMRGESIASIMYAVLKNDDSCHG